MEKKLTPDKAEQVTEKQIGDAKTQYISKAKSVAKGDPLFKIITDNKWYVVAYLPNNAVAGWEAGKTSCTLNMMTEEETYKISADVKASPQEISRRRLFSQAMSTWRTSWKAARFPSA